VYIFVLFFVFLMHLFTSLIWQCMMCEDQPFLTPRECMLTMMTKGEVQKKGGREEKRESGGI